MPTVTLDATTIGVTVSGLSAIIGAIVKLGLWLRKEVREIVQDANDKQLASDAFESRVTKLFAQGFASYADPINRAVSDLEARQRVHGERLGAVEQRVSALEGRAHASRAGDPP